MSVQMYQSFCKWFLEWGTLNGVFAQCFLVLLWNLACWLQNIVMIWMDQIYWSSCFDCFAIRFGHMKNDQTGNNAKYPWHLSGILTTFLCILCLLWLFISGVASIRNRTTMACCFQTMSNAHNLGTYWCHVLMNTKIKLLRLAIYYQTLGHTQ